VTLETTPTTYSTQPVPGIDISIGYPSSVSFPGTQFFPLEDPSDPASRLILLGGPFNLYDMTLVTFFDYETSIRTAITGGGLPPNGDGFIWFNVPEVPFERIRFDCPSDAELLASAFPCTINKIVNELGSDVAPPDCKVTIAR
jgi:hypothetical protein